MYEAVPFTAFPFVDLPRCPVQYPSLQPEIFSDQGSQTHREVEALEGEGPSPDPPLSACAPDLGLQEDP